MTEIEPQEIPDVATRLNDALSGMWAQLRERDELKQQLAECQAECVGLQRQVSVRKQLATSDKIERDDAVASLAKRSEELAECGIELADAKTQRNVMAGEAGNVQRRLTLCRDERDAIAQTCERVQNERDKLRAVCQWVLGESASSTIRDRVKAALEPTA